MNCIELQSQNSLSLSLTLQHHLARHCVGQSKTSKHTFLVDYLKPEHHISTVYLKIVARKDKIIAVVLQFPELQNHMIINHCAALCF